MITDLGADRMVLCPVIGCSWGHTARPAPDAPADEVQWLYARQQKIAVEHRKTHAKLAEVVDGPLESEVVAYDGAEPPAHVDVAVPSLTPNIIRLYRFTIAAPSGAPIGYVFSTRSGYLHPDTFQRLKYNDWVHAGR